MNELYRTLAVRKLDEWYTCVHARARIVFMLNGNSASRYPQLRGLLQYYNVKTRRLWNDFRRAYVQAMAQPVYLTG